MADAAKLRDLDCARPTRGRPRDEEKNVAILEAAVTLFLEKGYDSTSMDEIARHAGVSKQTVYSHFSGKQELFATAIRTTIEHYSVRQALSDVDQHTLEDDLRAVSTSFARLLVSREAIHMFRLLSARAALGNELAKIFWDSGPAIMIEEFVNFLRGWCDAGALKIDNLEEASRLMFWLLKGDLHFNLAIGLIEDFEDQQLTDHVEFCVDLFLKRYRA